MDHTTSPGGSGKKVAVAKEVERAAMELGAMMVKKEGIVVKIAWGNATREPEVFMESRVRRHRSTREGGMKQMSQLPSEKCSGSVNEATAARRVVLPIGD